MSDNIQTPQVTLSPEQLEQITNQIRKQVLEELRTEDAKKNEETKLRREYEHSKISDYADTMKNSPDPWVDARQVVDMGTGQIKIELDWNDAFIKECRNQGLSGATEEDVVRKYLAILTHNLDQQIVDESNTETQFE